MKYLYKLAKEKLHGSHDLLHIKRLLKNAKKLANVYGGKWKIIEAAILIHEFAKKNPKPYRNMLLKKFSKEDTDNIIHCIKTHYYLSGNKPKTIEAKIVQDCDTIDSIGAIGIVRAFMSAGEKNLDFKKAIKEYKKKRTSTFSALNLDESRKLAKENFRFTKTFFEKLDNELNK